MQESFAFEASLHKMLENRQVWLGLGVKSRLVLAKKKKERKLTLAVLLKVLNVRVQIYILHLYF